MKDEDFTLSWLINDRLIDVERVEENCSWHLKFGSGATLNIDCLWRIVKDGTLSSTSEDHGHKFGLPAPFDGVEALKELNRSAISAVALRDGTADVALYFGEYVVLEIIPMFGGYESWSASRPGRGTIIAGAQGKLFSYGENGRDG